MHSLSPSFSASFEIEKSTYSQLELIATLPLVWNTKYSSTIPYWNPSEHTAVNYGETLQKPILKLYSELCQRFCELSYKSIHRELHINFVNEDILMKKSKHQAKLAAHENRLAKSLTGVCSQSRLERKHSPAHKRNPEPNIWNK